MFFEKSLRTEAQGFNKHDFTAAENTEERRKKALNSPPYAPKPRPLVTAGFTDNKSNTTSVISVTLCEILHRI